MFEDLFTSSGSVITARIRVSEPQRLHVKGAPGRAALVHLSDELGPGGAALFIGDGIGRFFGVGLYWLRSLQMLLLPAFGSKPDHVGLVRPLALSP